MHLRHLTLNNFRNYRSLALELTPGPLILYGDNAQGKTNLLEAIYILATTRSNRTSNEKELLNDAAILDPLPVARLFTEVQRARDSVKVEIALQLNAPRPPASPSAEGLSAVRKRIRINGVVRRAIDVIGTINVVMFATQDIDLISGAPALRRRYLDLTNSRIDTRYIHSLQRYTRVLWQRNRLLGLLQQRRAQPDQLGFWTQELTKSGAYLVAQRQHLVQVLGELAHPIHRELSGGAEDLRLLYKPSIGKGESSPQEIESAFCQALESSRAREIAQGTTLVGPHRDDLCLQANSVDMGIYGSRGQQRTAALSLRLSEAQYLQDKTGDQPILLLDDVLSELDRRRRHHLLDFISLFQQVIITTTELESFAPPFLEKATRLKVVQGILEAT